MAACWLTIFMSCCNASSCGVAVGWQSIGKILNEAQWCGNPGKDVSVKAGEVEDGSQWPKQDCSRLPISQELCLNRPALSLLAYTYFCSWPPWTPPSFILNPGLYQLTDIVNTSTNGKIFSLLNANASITIVWRKLSSITTRVAAFFRLISPAWFIEIYACDPN